MWAVLQLLHRYRVDDYGTVPAARRLLVSSIIAVFVMIAAITTLTYCSGIWWVALGGSMFAVFGVGKVSWAVYMRRSGRYAAFYKARHWS